MSGTPSAPSLPPIPPPPPPPTRDEAVDVTAERRRKRVLASQKNSTILGGSVGSDQSVTRKTLLGQ